MAKITNLTIAALVVGGITIAPGATVDVPNWGTLPDQRVADLWHKRKLLKVEAVEPPAEPVPASAIGRVVQRTPPELPPAA